jgi:hypothetical protein
MVLQELKLSRGLLLLQRLQRRPHTCRRPLAPIQGIQGGSIHSPGRQLVRNCVLL